MTVTARAAPPGFLAEIGARVEARLTALIEADRARWSAVDPDLAPPLESLLRFVHSGGKRLRPVFCHWAFVGLGGDPDDPLMLDAGAALEMLHTFAVIHDDIMDASERRHGAETIHTTFTRLHRARGWRGEDRRFGEGAGILVGDLAFVYSDILLRGAPRPAWEIFDELRVEVNVGQYLDMIGTARGEATPELAARICRYKSAKYTIERPLHLGAALAAPDRVAEVLPAFSAYGLPLGEAFQLRDDILGTFGDPVVTGKAVGEDLREGKPTLLYALARQRAVGQGAALLRERFGAGDLSAGEVEAMQAVFAATGSRRDVEATIDRLVEESLAAAARLPVAAGARQALTELAHFVAGRNY
ncbi:MAG TPA: polyprenyl synthetase family protein [Acidimicrobiales bacterium]|nr:polyprenyl synthetase family protein [Acidimicrobiales bacterium]